MHYRGTTLWLHKTSSFFQAYTSGEHCIFIPLNTTTMPPFVSQSIPPQYPPPPPPISKASTKSAAAATTSSSSGLSNWKTNGSRRSWSRTRPAPIPIVQSWGEERTIPAGSQIGEQTRKEEREIVPKEMGVFLIEEVRVFSKVDIMSQKDIDAVLNA